MLSDSLNVCNTLTAHDDTLFSYLYMEAFTSFYLLAHKNMDHRPQEGDREIFRCTRSGMGLGSIIVL